jgi:hypothetical protein
MDDFYQKNHPFSFRDKVKNKLPKLTIIFSLIKANSLRNNGLSKKDLTQSKGKRIVKLGSLFFTLSLNKQNIYPPQ